MPSKKSKKGPTKGSGGKGRRSLEGKKGTLPKEQRHWYAEHQRRKQEQRPERPAAPAGESRPDGPAAPSGAQVLVGRNAVVEALRARVPATALYIGNSLDDDSRITQAARLAGEAAIPVHEVTRGELERRCDTGGAPGAAHQGIVLRVRPYDYAAPEDLLPEDAEAAPLIVALDGITDPHNLGAVARSAAAFAADGVVIPGRRAAGVTPAAWKASAGTLARLPVAQATNLTRALQDYKHRGLFVVGLDADGDTPLEGLDLADGPLVLVLGAEGKGLSRLVRETCDTVAAIPISGAESLNASVAAGVALYEVARRRNAAE